LALSRDKEGIRQLSQKGLVVEKPGDVIKNPFVLEFLDLEEKSAYSEHALKTAISICLMSNNLSLRLSRTKF
jgi:predicted nuclease of restriction endonuclease-like (RecB) superfamily